MYDESYEVSDGDTVQAPKLGFPLQERISIKSSVGTGITAAKQKSTSHIPASSTGDKDSHSSPSKGNLKFIKRPSTSVSGGNSNYRQDSTTAGEGAGSAGLTRSLETSRATFRVYSAVNNNNRMNTPAERPSSRTGSGKNRPITPDDVENAASEEDDEEEDDDEDDEYDNANRDNEESFERIESIPKRSFPERSVDLMDMDYTSSEDESVSLVSVLEGDDAILKSRNFPMRCRTGLASNSAMKISNLIPEDLFDAINESTEDDNEEESLRDYFERQHFREIQLDSKREDIKRRLLTTRGCDPHSIVGAGVHRHGYWMYNPADYENLKVSQDVKDVFQFITKYVPAPVNSQVDVKLKPFIPEYYPSVGDIDAFIKVAHPEVKNDTLGIKYLDEPSAFQSDPSVLDLRLRALAKQSSAKAVVVKKVENVSKNAKIIENWINDISDLHRSKPSPSVHYSKPMPDIDLLLQEWPPEVEDLLKSISFPLPDLDCDLATYVDIVCNLLDIPVYKSRIQSLHVLCTLYATHKNFSQYGGAMGNSHGTSDALIIPSSAPLKHEPDSSIVDRLEL